MHALLPLHGRAKLGEREVWGARGSVVVEVNVNGCADCLVVLGPFISHRFPEFL